MLLAGVRRDVLTVVDVPSGRTLVRRALRGASLGSDAFAADGASLALTAERHPSRPTARIHVVDVATGAVRRLGRWATAPSWGGVTRAPVGTRFAWSRPDAVVLAGRGERRALRVHALGRRVRVAGEPRFSPDGTRVAYVVAAGPGELARTGIAVHPVARAAGPPRLVVAFRRRGVGDPAWSPDGGALVFASG